MLYQRRNKTKTEILSNKTSKQIINLVGKKNNNLTDYIKIKNKNLKNIYIN